MTLPLDHQLWHHAVQLYEREGVKDTLLKLQNRHGYIVPCLLWAIWAAEKDVDLTTDEASNIVLPVVNMHRFAISPLRSVRRYLTSPNAGIPYTLQQDLREQVLETELAGEKLVLTTLAKGTQEALGERSHTTSKKADAPHRARHYFTVCGCYLETPRLLVDEEGPDTASALLEHLLRATGLVEASQ